MRAQTLFILTLLAAPAGGQTATELRPSATPQPDVWPYAAAELTVHNPSDESVGSVALRWMGGGPTLVLPAELAQRQRRTVPVFLPAVWPEQTYAVRLQTPGGAGAAEGEATISWPLDRVRSDAFIDPDTWQRWDPPPAAWSGATRRNATVAVALLAVAAAATLLVRGRGFRLGLLLAVLAAGAGAMVVLRPQPVEVRTPPAGVAPGGLVAAGARRTTVWELSEGVLAPVYLSRSEMASDAMVVDVAAGRVRAGLRAGEVRLFRRVGEPAR